MTRNLKIIIIMALLLIGGVGISGVGVSLFELL